MKLIDLLKVMDGISNVVIWTQDDDEEPYYTGPVMDVPWVLIDCEIGRPYKDDDEPVFVTIMKNDKGVELPVLVINILI